MLILVIISASRCQILVEMPTMLMYLHALHPAALTHLRNLRLLEFRMGLYLDA